MNECLLKALQLLIAAAILILDAIGIIPIGILSVLLITTFCILICDLVFDAIISLINFDFFNNSIYISAGTIALIFIANTKEALMCLIIFCIFNLIFKLLRDSFKSKITKITNKLLSKTVTLYSEPEASEETTTRVTEEDNNETVRPSASTIPCSELKPGDVIVLKPSEILPVDAALLDSSALFTPVFSVPGTSPTEFLQGDDIPGGFRLVSDTPITLTVTTHYEGSTFTRYIQAFKNSTGNSFPPFGLATILPKALMVLGIIGAIVSIFIPDVTKYSALLIFLTCCVVLPTENLITFADKMLFYSFQKGILVSGNATKLASTKAYFISRSAMVKTSEYSITEICPATDSVSSNKLLLYAAQAEIPYAHTDIGSILTNHAPSQVLLSSVKHTEKYEGRGVLTQYNTDTIHAGSKEFLQSVGTNDLPDFDSVETKSATNITYIYIALNGSYVGYIALTAPYKNAYEDFLQIITKNKDSAYLCAIGNPEERDELVATRQLLQKKCRTSFVAYIGSKPSDSALQSMSDYNIFLGPTAYCRQNDFTGVTIIPNSYKSLLRVINLSKKVYFTINIYTILFLLIKASLIFISFLLPCLKIWHIVLIDGIISTALIKVYNLLFRLFTRLN